VIFIGGNEDLIIESITYIWPFDFVSEKGLDELIKTSLSVILFALIVNLRKNLVGSTETIESPAALSIYPDSATYVDDDGYEAGVANLISNSNGALSVSLVFVAQANQLF
jgi:hypothetical protein